MQRLGPQETKGIHSVAALDGCPSGSLGAGASKPPKTCLPKAEPSSGGGWGFALLLTPPYLTHCSPTSMSWCRAGGLSRRCLHQVRSQGCGKRETGSKRDGCQLAGAQAGASAAMGQVGSPRASSGGLFPVEPS